MTDKRMTEDDVVAELRDGMTIGIGGWGSRRKPMCSCARSPAPTLQDLTVVSYGGPDVGLLCAAGKVRKVVYAFVLARLDPARAALPQRPPGRRGQTLELDEGMFLLGLQAAAWRVPFLPDPRRPRLRRRRPPARAPHRHVALRRRRGARRDARARPRRRARPHAPRRRAAATASTSTSTRTSTTCSAWPRRARFMSVEQVVDTDDLAQDGPVADAAHQPADDRRRGRGAARRALHRVRPRLRPRRGVPAGVRRERQGPPTRGPRGGRSTSTCGDHAEYRKVVGL